MSRNHNAMLEWDHKTGRYLTGWFIGSQGNDGEHVRDQSGWPYSIYRRAHEPGVTDAVLCDGIQALQDAQDMARMLNEAIK